MASDKTIEGCRSTTPYKMSAATFLSIVEDKSKRVGFCGPIVIAFDGNIDAESMATLRRLVVLTVERPNIIGGWVDINSNGGDLREALSFARLLRDRNIRYVTMEVPQESHCYSSCVFLLAGGFRREIYGEIGIHRPYFTDKTVHEQGYTSLQDAYDSVFAQLKSFFAHVNISDRLVSDMWLVTSDRLRILTVAELEQYGLSSDDTVMTELDNSKLRDVCGESAPAARDDFYKNVFNRCLSENSVLDKGCLNKRGHNHPYCRCYVATEEHNHSTLACD
jgi:hypothetical protein